MCIMLAGLRGIDEDIWKATSRRIGTVKLCHGDYPNDAVRFVTALVLIAAGINKLYDLVVGPKQAADQSLLRSAREMY
jgi:glucose/mannose transport system permease protein